MVRTAIKGGMRSEDAWATMANLADSAVVNDAKRIVNVDYEATCLIRRLEGAITAADALAERARYRSALEHAIKAHEVLVGEGD